MLNTRKIYEINFDASQYAGVKVIAEELGLKVKQVRGNKFRGNLVGICRMDFKANEDELVMFYKKLKKYFN